MGKAREARKIIKAGNFIVPTPEQVEAAKTPSGGWTAKQLAKWGVPWPPQAGWRDRLYERWAAREPPGVDRPSPGQVRSAEVQQRRDMRSRAKFERARQQNEADELDLRYPGYEG